MEWNKNTVTERHLTGSVSREYATLDLEIMSLSPTVGVELTNT